MFPGAKVRNVVTIKPLSRKVTETKRNIVRKQQGNQEQECRT